MSTPGFEFETGQISFKNTVLPFFVSSQNGLANLGWHRTTRTDTRYALLLLFFFNLLIHAHRRLPLNRYCAEFFSLRENVTGASIDIVVRRKFQFWLKFHRLAECRVKCSQIAAPRFFPRFFSGASWCVLVLALEVGLSCSDSSFLYIKEDPLAQHPITRWTFAVSALSSATGAVFSCCGSLCPFVMWLVIDLSLQSSCYFGGKKKVTFVWWEQARCQEL